MRGFRLVSYTIKISIVVASLTLLYAYWESIEQAYSRASAYVKEVNAQFHIREEAGAEEEPSRRRAEQVPKESPKRPVPRIATAPVAKPPPPPALPPAVQPPVLRRVPRQAESKPHTPQPPPLPSFDDIIRQARAAAKKKDYRKAVQLYRMLIRYYPERYEPYGELGNIYYFLHRYEEAGKLYYQAALRLHKAGMTKKAWRLQKALERIAPRYAKRLKQALSKP